VRSVLLIFLVFVCVVLLCVITFLVPCCDVCYGFHIKKMFGSFLHSVVCRSSRVFLCLFSYSGVQHILCCVFCFCIGCLRFVSCTPNVASFSGLSILDCLFGFL